MSGRRWTLPVFTGLATTCLGVSINLATELKSNVWAWVAVVVLTAAGILVGAGSDRMINRRQADGTIVNRGTMVTVAGEKNRVKVSVVGPGSVIVIGLTVIVAVVAGLLAGRAGTANGGRAVPPTAETETKPFDVTVLDDPTDALAPGWYGNSSGYLFPSGTVSSLPAPEPPDDCVDWSTWAMGKGGVRVNQTTLAFTVAALGEDAVRVHSVKLHVERKEGRASGDEIICFQGGPIPVSSLRIDLDQERATYEYPQDGPMAGRSRPFGLQIAPGQAEQVEVKAISTECYCSWYLELMIEAKGVEYHYNVDDDGRPFVTAPLHGDYALYRFDIESYRWEPFG